MKQLASILLLLLVQSFLRSAETFEVKINGVNGDVDYLGYPTNTLTAIIRGKTDALRDVSNGVLRLPMYGLPAEWASDYFRIFRDRYGVQQYVLAGCSVSEGLIAYAEGYGKVSGQAIKARFGTNIFAMVHAEARRFYKKRSNLEIPVFAPALQTHRVRLGESLISIAKQHHVSLEALMEANPRITPINLQLNQVLLLPERLNNRLGFL